MRETSKSARPRLLIELVLLLLIVIVLVPIAWTALQAFLPNRAIVNRSWDFPV